MRPRLVVARRTLRAVARRTLESGIPGPCLVAPCASLTCLATAAPVPPPEQESVEVGFYIPLKVSGGRPSNRAP